MFLAKRRRKKGEAEEEDDEERLEPRAPRDEDERDYMSTVARMAMR